MKSSEMLCLSFDLSCLVIVKPFSIGHLTFFIRHYSSWIVLHFSAKRTIHEFDTKQQRAQQMTSGKCSERPNSPHSSRNCRLLTSPSPLNPFLHSFEIQIDDRREIQGDHLRHAQSADHCQSQSPARF